MLGFDRKALNFEEFVKSVTAIPVVSVDSSRTVTFIAWVILAAIPTVGILRPFWCHKLPPQGNYPYWSSLNVEVVLDYIPFTEATRSIGLAAILFIWPSLI